MKHWLKIFSIILSSLVIFSCNNDDPVSNNTSNNLITSVSGPVSGLPAFAKVLKAVVKKNSAVYLINSDTIGNNYVMNFDLTVPPPQYLSNVQQFLTSTGGTTVISDIDANVGSLSLDVYDSLDRISGFVIRDNHISTNELFPGYVVVSAFYCDRNLSITGRSIEVQNMDTTILAYNANFETGWNLVSLRVKDVRTGFIEFEFFNGEYLPASAAWTYYPSATNLFNKVFLKD